MPVRKILTSDKPLGGLSVISPDCDHRRMSCTALTCEQRTPKDCLVEPLNLGSDGRSEDEGACLNLTSDSPRQVENGRIGHTSPAKFDECSTSPDELKFYEPRTSSCLQIEVCPAYSQGMEGKLESLSISSINSNSCTLGENTHGSGYVGQTQTNLSERASGETLRSCTTKTNQDDPCGQRTNFGLDGSGGDSRYGIFPLEWSVERNLSRGRFGYVDIIEDDNSNRRYVLKTCDPARSEREFSILSECQGKFVSKLCGSSVRSGERLMFLKHYELGDLNQWLEKDKLRDKFDEKTAVWITANIYSAVDFIERRGILHLDIKPTNILIDDKGYPILADFGNARRLHECQRPGETKALTSAYTSPELLKGRRANKMADLWATACCFYEIVKGRSPFLGRSVSETELKISLGVAPECDGLSSAACSFLALEFDLSPAERLGYHRGASAVVCHELFSQLDWFERRPTQSPLLQIISALVRTSVSTSELFPVCDSSSSSDCLLDQDKAPPRRKQRRRRRRREIIPLMTQNSAAIDGYLGDNEDLVDKWG